MLSYERARQTPAVVAKSPSDVFIAAHVKRYLDGTFVVRFHAPVRMLATKASFGKLSREAHYDIPLDIHTRAVAWVAADPFRRAPSVGISENSSLNVKNEGYLLNLDSLEVGHNGVSCPRDRLLLLQSFWLSAFCCIYSAIFSTLWYSEDFQTSRLSETVITTFRHRIGNRTNTATGDLDLFIKPILQSPDG
jgi:hypothetical protein